MSRRDIEPPPNDKSVLLTWVDDVGVSVAGYKVIYIDNHGQQKSRLFLLVKSRVHH